LKYRDYYNSKIISFYKVIITFSIKNFKRPAITQHRLKDLLHEDTILYFGKISPIEAFFNNFSNQL